MIASTRKHERMRLTTDDQRRMAAEHYLAAIRHARRICHIYGAGWRDESFVMDAATDGLMLAVATIDRSRISNEKSYVLSRVKYACLAAFKDASRRRARDPFFSAIVISACEEGGDPAFRSAVPRPESPASPLWVRAMDFLLAGVSARDRDWLEWRVVGGEAYTEIANQCGVPVSQVKQAVKRCIERLNESEVRS